MADGDGDRSRWPVHASFGLVMLVVVGGLFWVAMSHWREGTVLLGGALLLAATLRALLPSGRAGLLEIRSRPIDVLLYAALGLLIVFVAVTITSAPLQT